MLQTLHRKSDGHRNHCIVSFLFKTQQTFILWTTSAQSHRIHFNWQNVFIYSFIICLRIQWLIKIGDLYNSQKVLMTFGEMLDKFNIPCNHFFKNIYSWEIRLEHTKIKHYASLKRPCIPEHNLTDITALYLMFVLNVRRKKAHFSIVFVHKYKNSGKK